MSKPNPSREQEKLETSESSSEEEEENRKKPDEHVSATNQNTMSEYEKLRMSRIALNNARMEALGLRKLASSMPKAAKGKGKRKATFEDEDDEYAPNDDDGMDVDDDDDDEDQDFGASKTRKKMGKNKIPKHKKKAYIRKQTNKSDLIDEDKELMQAIALSLQDSVKVPGVVPIKEEKGNSSREDIGKKKRKNTFASRVKMTEDEFIIHFFQFDEAGKGNITARDLEKMALAHDFTWTDKELADMIHYFDSDGDGQLSLEDFRNIVDRCNMMQDSGSRC